MDNQLLTIYANAIRARPLIAQLPPGPREYVQQFEQLTLQDIRAQSGNPNLTEQDILAMIKPTVMELINQAIPVVANIVIGAIKKHYPTSIIAGAVSVLINYLMQSALK
jgi:hypothetical protein